jgi:methylated-DNA-[protein]-cysteine S-methyltransferase
MNKVQNCSYSLFPSSFGVIGLSWSEEGLMRLQLPESTEQMTRHRLIAGYPSAMEALPPNWVGVVIENLQKHLNGNLQDFSEVPLDFRNVSEFFLKVYLAAKAIPAGVTKTYGEIAKAIQAPNASRAVGLALGRNPIALVVPCHRVIAANGRPGGFSAFGGLNVKQKLLEREGVFLKLR